MSPQGLMARKASYNPGLNPIEGHIFALVRGLDPEISSRTCFGYHQGLAIGPRAGWPASFVNLA